MSHVSLIHAQPRMRKRPAEVSEACDPIRVRGATLDDLDALVRVHLAAFSGFFLTRLGPAFLREYYRGICEYPMSVVMCGGSGEREAIDGFVAGFASPPAFYSRLRARRWRLLAAALPGVIRHPSIVPRLLGNSRRVQQDGHRDASVCESELASLAVTPSAQGAGLGKELVRAFLSQSRVLGATRVTLATDADNNDNTNRFYQSLGFRVAETFHSGKYRRMHRYEYHLAQNGTLRD